MTQAVAPLVKTYDEFLVHTHPDRIEIFNEDITNPLVVLPIVFAKKLAADLVLHTAGAIEELKKPVLGLLNLQTVDIPRPGMDVIPEDNVYQSPVEISQQDVFTGLTMAITCEGTIDTDPVDVYIDGDKNGSMQTFDGLTWTYVPGTPVHFTVGLHVIEMTFANTDGDTTTATLRFASV